MAIDTKILKGSTASKPVVLPTWIKPVGIAQPVNVGGEVATKTAGKGTGIFNGILNIAETAFSTFTKKATASAQTKVADQVGSGSNTFVDADSNGKPNVEPTGGNPIVKIGVILVILKLLNII